MTKNRFKAESHATAAWWDIVGMIITRDKRLVIVLPAIVVATFVLGHWLG